MKQTNSAIKFLMAQYRAIFNNAYFKGLATAAVVTVGLAAGQAQAADTTITLGETADAAVEINVTEGTATATADDTNKFAKFVKVQKGATLNLSGSVTSLGNAEINGGTLNVASDSALYLGSIKDFDSDKSKQAYEFDLKATAGSTLNLNKGNIGVKDFDITGSTITLTSGGVGGTNLTAYGAGAYQGDDGPKALSREAQGKLTDVTANLEGGTNITAIGHLEIKGTADGKSVVNLKGLQSADSTHTTTLAYLGGSTKLTIDNTTINVKEGAEGSKGTAIASPDLNISNSKIVIAGAHDQLTLGGLFDRNSAGGAAVESGDYTEGSVVLNKTDITISNATGALNLGNGENSKTEFTINDGTIDNKGVVNVYAPKVSLSAAHFDALIKGKLDVKSNSELNIAGDLDFSKALTEAGALETDKSLVLTDGKTLKVVSDGAVTLGSAFAANNVTVEGGVLKVAAGEEFQQTSGALVALNGLTTADGKDLTKFTVSGSASAATTLTLGTDASSKGSVTKIGELNVVGNTQSGALTINGNWDLTGTKLTVGESGSASLNDATVAVKGFDVAANGSLALVNSTLSTTGDVKSAENVITLADNSTLKVAYGKVVNEQGAAKTDTLAAVSGDGTSTVVLTGHSGDFTLAQLTNLKSSFLGSDGQGLFKVENVNITDKVAGSEVTVDQAANAAGLADVYDQATVTGVTNTAITTTNDWGAVKLAESNSDKALVIGANGTITLNGVGGKLVTESDGTTDASVKLGDATATLNVQGNGGTLQNITGSGKALVGATLNVKEDIGADGTTLAELNVQNNGVVNAVNVYATDLNVAGILKTTGDVKVGDSGAAISGNVEVLGKDKAFASSGDVVITGSLKATSLKLETANDHTVSVGDADSTGFLEVGSIDLNGGKLLLDPSFQHDATVVALKDVTNPTDDVVNANGDIGVGMNSVLAVGNDAANAQSIASRLGYLQNGKLQENGVGAVLVANDSLSINDGKNIVINPKSDLVALEQDITTAGGNAFVVANGGALVVTEELTQQSMGDSGKAIIQFATPVSAKVDFAAGSTLQFDTGLTAKDTIKLTNASDEANITLAGDIIAANGLLSGLEDTANPGVIKFELKEDEARQKLTAQSKPVQDLTIAALRGDFKDPNGAANEIGVDYILLNAGLNGGKSIEGTANLALYGGVVQGTALAQQAANDAVVDRMSRSNPNGSLVFANNAQGGGLWLSPVYKTHESDSFDADGVDYGVDGDLTGLVLGADSTSESGVRVGGYFNFGSADFDGQGVGDQVSNEADYFGFGLYAGMTAGQFSLLADAGFTQASNDIEQNTDSSKYSKVTADVDSTAVTLGLRGEYKLNVATMDVTPHLGVRYTRLAIDSYDAKVNGKVLATTDFDTMQMFSIPFGVTVSKDIAAGAWTIKPVFDLTLTANAGDTDAKLNTTLIGTTAVDITSEAFDSFTYGATFGLDAQYGENFSIGLNTNYTGSSNADEFGVMGNARYMF